MPEMAPLGAVDVSQAIHRTPHRSVGPDGRFVSCTVLPLRSCGNAPSAVGASGAGLKRATRARTRATASA